jgi:hypothetical protein
LNETYQLLVSADTVNIFSDNLNIIKRNLNTIKRNKEALLEASRKVCLEVNKYREE